MPNIIEGTRVVSVVQVPGGRWTYLAPKVYEAQRRRRDGALTWRCVDAPLGSFRTRHGHTFQIGFRSRAVATARVGEIAHDLGIEVIEGLRHGATVRQ